VAVSQAVFVGLGVTAGCMIIGAEAQILMLWMLGPLLGGIIAGILTKNGRKNRNWRGKNKKG